MVGNPHRCPSRRRCAPLVFLALLLSPGDARAQESNPARETFLRLTGIVRDARTGEGIAGASVTVTWGSVDEWVLTDSAGRYVLERPYDGRHTPEMVRVYRPGYLPEARHVALYCLTTIRRAGEPGYCDKKLSFELRSTDRLFEPSAAFCSVTVSVLDDERGTPLAGLVTLEREERRGVTDDAGRLTFDNVPSGLHPLRASVIGFFTQEKLVIVACAEGEPAEPVTVRMLPAAVALIGALEPASNRPRDHAAEAAPPAARSLPLQCSTGASTSCSDFTLPFSSCQIAITAISSVSPSRFWPSSVYAVTTLSSAANGSSSSEMRKRS